MKQLFVKWFAVLLSLAVLINTAHLTLATAAPETTSSVPAEETVVSPGEENVSADTAEESDYEEELFIIGEDTSRRQENEKHFRMSDGSYVATVYPEAVHYSDDGKWEDINNTLTLTEDGYRNTAGSFEVVFGDGSSRLNERALD